MKKLSFALAAVGVMATTALAADKLESGLKPGASTAAFDVVDVSGPNKGKQLCYV